MTSISLNGSGAFLRATGSPSIVTRPDVLAERYPQIGYDPNACAVTVPTAQSLARLSFVGIDARIVQLDTPSFVSAEVGQQVIEAVKYLERRFPKNGLKDHLFNGDVHSLGSKWSPESKRAHSLLILSYPKFKRLGGNANSDALLAPIFHNGRSALDLLIARDPEKGLRIVDKVTRFLGTEIYVDGKDEFGLSSWEYLAAVPDSVAIQKREALGGKIIGDYGISIPEVRDGKRGLRIASFACGAGNMMCKLVPLLKAKGINVDSIDNYDHDPVALAVARSHADGSGIGNIVDTHLFNVLKRNPSKELKNLDVKEILGLFEYLDEVVGGRLAYELAGDFLHSLGKDMKPGSMILFGNMVRSRPHQTMFNQVWPKLQQRSPEEVVELILSAGYPRDSIGVHMSDDGIYAEYTIKIPEGGLDLPRRSLRQILVKGPALRGIQDY